MGWEFHNRKRKADGTFDSRRCSRRISIRIDDLTLGMIRARAYARGQSMTGYLIDLVNRDHQVSGNCTPTGKTGASGLSRAARGRLAQPLTGSPPYN